MGSSVSNHAYALTVLSPIREGHTSEGVAYADHVRDQLQDWNSLPNSPMALVPQTYLCRFYVLDDVPVQSQGGNSALDALPDLLPMLLDSTRRWAIPVEDHLKSRYLVFSCDLHCGASGSADAYLRGMWDAISPRILDVWEHCYGFEEVCDADSFLAYMKKCMLPAALFFNGSNDAPLPEQLKALYLKQELVRFVGENQGLDPATLRARFQDFLERVAPADLTNPATTWAPGKYRL